MLLRRREREKPPPRKMRTRLRLKKTRRVGHIDPRAKMRRSKANTGQRKEMHRKVAVKAERRLTDTGEVAQGVRTEMVERNVGSPNPITIMIEVKVMTLINVIARIDQQKIGTDPAAGNGTGVELQTKERRAGRGAENTAGVRRDDTTARGRSEEHPGIRSLEQEVQTETSLEIHTEDDDPEAGAIKKSTAKIGPIERTKTGRIPPKGEDVVAALRTIETRKGRVRRAQILDMAEQVAPPKIEAMLKQDQTKLKTKTGTTARGGNQVLAQALIVTEIVQDKGLISLVVCSTSFPSEVGFELVQHRKPSSRFSQTK